MSIPTPHNAAQKGDIARRVLMPGAVSYTHLDVYKRQWLSCVYMGWFSEEFCRLPADASRGRILWQCMSWSCIVCPSRVIKCCQIRQYKIKTLILQRFAFWGVISAGQGLFLFPVKIKVFQRWWFHLQATLKSLNIYIRGIKYPRLQKQTGMNELCFTVPPELPRYGSVSYTHLDVYKRQVQSMGSRLKEA